MWLSYWWIKKTEDKGTIVVINACYRNYFYLSVSTQVIYTYIVICLTVYEFRYTEGS